MTPACVEAMDEQEFVDALYAQHSRALMFFVMRLNSGDVHSAEDIVQETMIRAWRSADALRTSGRPLRPWLFTVARRLVIDAKRLRDRRPDEVGSGQEADVAIDTGFEAVHSRDELIRALRALSPAQREVIVGVYYLGMSVTEVSRILRIPPGTVKSRTHYVLKSLRVRLLAEQSAA